MLYRHFFASAFTLGCAWACVSGSPDPGPGEDEGGGGTLTTGGASGTAGSGTPTGGTQAVAGSAPTGGTSGTGTGGAAAGAGGSGVAGLGGTGAGAGGSAGGSATGGTSVGGTATGGTGGAPVNPYPGGKGFIPSNVRASDALAAWNTFKTQHVQACGAQFRVASNGNETVSEGIAYGMLAAVAHGDRATFDGLWNYYKGRRNGNGVMNWRIDACTTNATGMGGATDAELDAAMALIQAECKWTGYRADATALLNAIRMSETGTSGGLSFVLPGDSWGATGPNCLNPSYFSPAYFRSFARFDSAQAAFWNKLATDSYTLLGRATNMTTGLVPDWSNLTGQAGGGAGCRNANVNYSWDAVRTPWRIATDYLWWGTADAGTWLSRVSNWAAAAGGGPFVVSEVISGHSLSGTKLDMGARNSAFSGSFAMAGYGHSQARADDFTAAFLSVNQAQGDNAYFQRALRVVYLLLPAGIFPSGC